MRTQLRDLLTSAGYDVVGEAANGVEALLRYDELQPDVVTMDLVMPVRGGVDATRDIRQKYPQARVVVCSGLGEEHMAVDAIEAGARDYINKAGRPDEILAIVKRALGET